MVMVVDVKKRAEFRWQVIPKMWCSEVYGSDELFG